MRGLAWATALFVTSALGAAPPEAPEVYALVVGHNGGLPATTSRPALPSLRFADDDALRLARWFQMLGGADHVVVLTEPDDDTRATWRAAGLDVPATQAPTRANLFAAIDQLKAQLAARVSGRPAVLYFFYAGHGVTGRFLLKPEGALDAGLTGHELRVRLGELEVDRVELFVDACRALWFFAEGGAAPDLSAEIDELENRRRHPVFGVLTATQSDRPAGETSQLQGGFFSHVLASGLAGAADVNGDDVVGFGELAAFVAFNTEALTGQRPWFEAPGGDLSAPVVDLHGGPRLRLNAETHGRIRVLSATGVPVFAEMNKAAGRPARLVLPVGHYQVMQPLRRPRGPRVTTVDYARRAPGARTTAHSDRVASAATRGLTASPWAELCFFRRCFRRSSSPHSTRGTPRGASRRRRPGGPVSGRSTPPTCCRRLRSGRRVSSTGPSSPFAPTWAMSCSAPASPRAEPRSRRPAAAPPRNFGWGFTCKAVGAFNGSTGWCRPRSSVSPGSRVCSCSHRVTSPRLRSVAGCGSKVRSGGGSRSGSKVGTKRRGYGSTAPARRLVSPPSAWE